jgi:two-component system cell cycle sensor histidine kinase/response regulator CckA
MTQHGQAAASRGCDEKILTILLVDDEEALRGAIRDALDGDGYRVLDAANGKDALEVLARWSGQVDLLLTDVLMPIMGGPELVRSVRALWPRTPVIFMSGSLIDGIALEPCSAFLHKPFRYAALAEAISSAIGPTRPTLAGP